jgi:hypothetical protein
MGALHFKPVSSAGRHPATQTVRDFSSIVERITTARDSDYLQQLRKWPQIKELPKAEQGNALRAITGEFLRDIHSFSFFARIWQNQVNRLLRSEAERLLLEQILEGINPRVDQREDVLFQLAKLSVPSFSPDISALVAIRRQDGIFGEFRHDLAEALQRITISETSDPSEMAAARAVLTAELAPNMERLQKVADRSPALASLKTGVTGFGISAISAGVGYLAGGSLVTALASAGATKAIDAAMKYKESLQQRRRDRAVRDLVVSLRGTPLP